MSKFETLAPVRLSDGVFRQIFRLISNGTLEAGERLPPERELARNLGVSRSSAREGLRVLDQLGLVDVRQGAGAFVVKNAWKAGSGLLWLPWLIEHRDQVIELLQVREVVEPEMAKIAAGAATSQDRRDLRSIHDEFSRALAANDSGAAVALDREFHARIAEVSKNKTLATLVSSLHEIVHQKIGGPYHYRTCIGASAIREHAKLLEAIGKGSGARAATAMRLHLRNIRATFENAIGSAGELDRTPDADLGPGNAP
jgi:GntR family transcriptional repressor for pyruvate dehydrogenase complex